MKTTIPLLPYRAKIIGLFAIVIGSVFSYTYFNIGKPEWLNVKVFAIVSYYVNKSYFSVIQTNIIDELGAILIIAGLMLIFFSKEKNEQAIYNNFRIKAIINSIWVLSILWMLSFLTIYGIAIFLVSSIIFLLFILSCNIFYRTYILRYKRVKKLN